MITVKRTTIHDDHLEEHLQKWMNAGWDTRKIFKSISGKENYVDVIWTKGSRNERS